MSEHKINIDFEIKNGEIVKFNHDGISEEVAKDFKKTLTGNSAKEIQSLEKQVAILKEAVDKMASNISPYAVLDEHRDTLERRFHEAIFKAREALKQIEEIEKGE